MKKISFIALTIFFVSYFFVIVSYAYSSKRAYAPPLSTSNPKVNLASRNKNESTKVFKYPDVSNHNTRKDCYLIISGNVYNISSYISYHPGGSKTIVSRCGKEVTSIFAKIHSNRAWDLLKRYKIGVVSTKNKNDTEQTLSTISSLLQKQKPGAEIIKITPKNDFYIAKVNYQNKLYEIHIDKNGKIFKEEVELDWSLWEKDTDDNQK